MRTTLTHVVLPIGLLLLAIIGFVTLKLLMGTTERLTPPARIPTVEVALVSARTSPIEVRGTGTVEAGQQVRLVPEVSGTVSWVSQRLRPGASFERGETIARINSTAYQAQVAGEESRLRQAELELALERGRKEVALREWEMLGDGRAAEDSPLALRVPQGLLA